MELSGDRREESVMTDMKKNIKRTAVLSMVLVLMFATTVFGAEQTEEYVPAVYATFWALVPPVVAIGLALITKEVYSSLFIGVLMGGILYSGFSFEGTITHIFEDGMINVLSDSYNVGILIFLVILGTMVCLMTRRQLRSALSHRSLPGRPRLPDLLRARTDFLSSCGRSHTTFTRS